MTEAGRQQERPGAGDAGGGQRHEGYREAPEFARRDGKPSETGTPFETLRVFKDGNDVPRAGLYPGTTPEVDDHWAHGDPMTDETDVAVARRLTGDAESETSDALLGIAYGRLLRAGGAGRKSAGSHPAAGVGGTAGRQPAYADVRNGDQQDVGRSSGCRERPRQRGARLHRGPDDLTRKREKDMEFKAISDVIVRRLEGRCRFRISTREEQTAGQQGPDIGVYSVPARLRCVRGASTRFENAMYTWLRACKGTSAADPTSRDYGRWQPGARCCKLTLIDDGPRVEKTARALARMPHEESRAVGQDMRTWLNSRHPWTG